VAAVGIGRCLLRHPLIQLSSCLLKGGETCLRCVRAGLGIALSEVSGFFQSRQAGGGGGGPLLRASSSAGGRVRKWLSDRDVDPATSLRVSGCAGALSPGYRVAEGSCGGRAGSVFLVVLFGILGVGV
jgi:hypothetical protein